MELDHIYKEQNSDLPTFLNSKGKVILRALLKGWWLPLFCPEEDHFQKQKNDKKDQLR